MAQFSRGMDKAPRDGRQLQVLVPTGDPNTPLSREIAWWAKERTSGGEGWEGDWRYDDEPGNWADALPIAWAPILEISVGMWAEFAEKAKADIAAREKAAAEAAAVAAKKALPPPPGVTKPVKHPPGKRPHGVDMTTGRPVSGFKPRTKPAVDVFEPL